MKNEFNLNKMLIKVPSQKGAETRLNNKYDKSLNFWTFYVYEENH